MSGIFVAVEGIEGSGKSTLVRGLADRASNSGKNVLLTKEPGGTEIGAHLREILLNSAQPITPKAEIFLFLADRAQHVSELLRPSKDAGMFVITDRYLYSTVAYQGFARGLDLNQLRKMNEFAIDGFLPTKVLVVDLPVNVALARASARRKEASSSWNRFEDEEIVFHEKVRQGFLALAKEDPKRFAVLNGELPANELLEAAAQELKL